MPFPGSANGYDTQPVQVSAPLQAPGLTPPIPVPPRVSSLIFVDAGVQDAQGLLSSRNTPDGSTRVVYLNSTEDAIDQITRTLLNYQGIASLHVISHGDQGQLKFSSGWLGADNLGQYTAQLKSWSQALSTDADVLLYGCDVAGGIAGDAFIRQLSQLTQADVAASTNTTGKGGDWILEANTGSIESAIIPDGTAQAAYGYSLDKVNLVSQSDPLLASDAVGGEISDRSVSDDGQFVVFSSSAPNLVPGDTNNRKDVFLYNRTTGTTKLISHVNAVPTKSSDGDSFGASISADGKFVVFLSNAKNLTSDTITGSSDQLYRWDAATDTTLLISKTATGIADKSTSKAVISDDGQSIAFISTATNIAGSIVDGQGNARAIKDVNGRPDAFLWKNGAGISLISLRSLSEKPLPNPETSNLGVGSNIDISGDGRFVVFDTLSNLSQNIDRNNAIDIYLYDAFAPNGAELVSFNAIGDGSTNPNFGNAAGGAAATVSFKANKLRIVFTSNSALTDGDTNGRDDVFVAEREYVVDPNEPNGPLVSGGDFTIKLVSLNTAGTTSGDAASNNAVISASGRYVAFVSSATNLVTGDSNANQDVFVRDLDAVDPTIATRLVSRNSTGGTLGNGRSSKVQISNNGEVVSFVSAATNLIEGDVANDVNGVEEDVFVYDRAADKLSIVSQKFGTTKSADVPGDSRILKAAVVSGDGQVVLYENDAINLVDKDTNDAIDIFAYDVATAANALVTKVANNQNSVTGSGLSAIQPQGAVSKDGRYVVFVSDVNSLVSGDRNGQQDVFLRDTTLPSTNPNAIKLISHLATDAKKSGSGTSSAPFISADGKYVVFSSTANDLVAGDTNGEQDVFLYTVADGSIALVSKGAAPADGASESASVAVNGTEVYVTFTSRATNLGATVAGGFSHVYLWTKSTGQVKLVSRTTVGTGTTGGNQDSIAPVISADGKYIAFTSNATNLAGVTTDTNAASDVFLYNITADTLTLVSKSAAGAIGNGASSNVVISDINGVVAFQSKATNLTAIADTNGQTDVFRYSAATGVSLISVNAAGNASGTGAGQPLKEEGSFDPSINADGTAIAFTSTATNLTTTLDANGDWDVFVRNTTTNKTTLISQVANAASNGSSGNAVISGDGQTVAFISNATNLSALDADPTADVYVSGVLTPAPGLISANTTGTAGSDADVLTVSLNRDGGVVVFDSAATNLVTNDANGFSDVFQRPTKSLVSLKTITATATEGSTTANGVYELNRTEPIGALQVKLKLATLVGSGKFEDFTLTADGTATVAIDVATGIATITMPDAIDKVTLTLKALADNKAEADEAVTFALDVNSAYSIDPINNAGTVTIAANETIVTTNADSGEGSLRQAIANANAFAGADTISFALATPAQKTIALATELDALTGETTIDGGTSGIILDGATAGTTANGLTLDGGKSIVKNITVQNFKGNGIVLNSDDNTIGGTTATTANTITKNNTGVVVKTGKTGNQILGNKIDANTLLGIDLEPIGADVAQPLVIATAVPTATGATITGTLTKPAGTYRVEFFASTTQDASQQGEGEIFLGFKDIVVDTTGTAAVSFTAVTTGLTGKYVTATVTDATGTSEFAKNKRLTPPLPLVDLSPGVLELAEGNNPTTPSKYSFKVKLSQVTATPLTLKYRTIAGTPGAGIATEGTDFTGVTNGTVTIAANSDTATFDIDIKGDTRYELDETFQVELFDIDPLVLSEGTLKATGKIKNDDLKPTISFSQNSFSKAEGQAGPNGSMPITVTLSNASDEIITVDYKTVDGTAISTAVGTNPADFVGIPTTALTFNPGETSKDILVELVADTLDEPNETFTVELSAPTNATLSGGLAKLTATGNITPDEQGYTFSVLPLATPRITEGKKGATQILTFTVTLDRAPTEDITVDYSTVNGTAEGTITGGTDFVSKSGTLTFKAGDPLTKTVDVVVNGDDIANGDRNFTLELSNPTAGRAIVDPDQQASAVTIVDDDLPKISFKVGDITRIEGSSGTSQVGVTIELSAVADQDVTVEFTTVDGTGADAATVADNDYVPRTTAGQKIKILKGLKTATAFFEINGDTKIENDETFFIKLSNPVGAVLDTVDTKAIVILDDDKNSTTLPKITITPNLDPTTGLPQTEGNTGTKPFTFTVTLDKAPVAGKDVTVTVATVNGNGTIGTATSTGPNPDFTAKTQNLTFTAGGSLSQTFTVLVNGDTQVEPDETFTVQLSGATNGTIATPTAIATIKDDDALAGTPKISITAIKGSDTEGNSGTKTLTYAVTLDQALTAGQSVTVDVVTVDGTGPSGAVSTGTNADFVSKTQKLTFTAGGALTQQFDVVINGDTQPENTETFNVELRNVSGAVIAQANAIGTIIDDDTIASVAPIIAINSVSSNEGDTGTKPFVFDINLTNGPADRDFTVTYEIIEGSAKVSDNDYQLPATGRTGTVTFKAGDTKQTITVLVNGDKKLEGTDTFSIKLSGPTNGASFRSGGDTAIGSILNDDIADPGNNISLDSRNDLLWRNPQTGETVLWQTNLGPTTRTFTSGSITSFNTPDWRYAGSADFDGDGDSDLLWHNTQTGLLGIWKMNGPTIESVITDIITPAQRVAAPWFLQDISDYNRDGSPDLLWYNKQTGAVSISLMNGFSFVSAVPVRTVADLNWKIEAVGNFAGDAQNSIFWRHQPTGRTVLWRMSDTRVSSNVDLSLSDANLAWQVRTTADMNGDGISDLVWQNNATNAISVWYMQRSGVLKQANLPTPGQGFKVIGSGDFNQDGIQDLLLQNSLTGQNQVWYFQQSPTGIVYGGSAYLPNSVSDQRFLGLGKVSRNSPPSLLWLNNTSGDLTTWQVTTSSYGNSVSLPSLSSVETQIVATVDLNRDGKAEVIVRNVATNLIELGDFTGQSYNRITNFPTLDQTWAYRGTGDIDGDGQNDVYWQQSSTGKVAVWRTNNNQYLDTLTLTPASASWRLDQIGDFNGDGKSDLFWRNQQTDQTFVSISNGTAAITGAFMIVVPKSWQIVKAIDLDKDGKTDFIWKNVESGLDYVAWLMNGTSMKNKLLFPNVGEQGWVIKEVADFNRDGNPDILWYNARLQQANIWNLESGVLKTISRLPKAPSPSWDLVGSRDFNGDGSRDLLWLDRATGTPTIWYMNDLKYATSVSLPNLSSPNFQLIGLDDYGQTPT